MEEKLDSDRKIMKIMKLMRAKMRKKMNEKISTASKMSFFHHYNLFDQESLIRIILS